MEGYSHAGPGRDGPANFRKGGVMRLSIFLGCLYISGADVGIGLSAVLGLFLVMDIIDFLGSLS